MTRLKGRIIAMGLYPALLIGINLLVAAKLFTISYTAYLESNEGTYIAIAQRIASGRFDFGWWPLWDLGMPYQNTYLPLLHLIVGAVGRVSGAEIPLLYHRIAATFYVIGPVTLYAMAYWMTKRPHASLLAAAAYSLVSPANFLLPMVQRDLGSVLYLRRLNILDYYGEGPYTAAIAMLPLAVLFLYLAITQRRFWLYVLAGAFCGATVLFNAFGAIMLVIVSLSLLATIRTDRLVGNALVLTCIGVMSYVWISPLLPPSVVSAIRANSPTVGGDFRFTSRSAVGLGIIAVGFLITWFATRRFEPSVRVFGLIAVVTSGIVLLGFRAGVYVLPQPTRYQGVMDLALCLFLAFAGTSLLRELWPKLRGVAVVLVILFGAYQLRVGMHYAEANVRGGDVTHSAAYRIAKWADANMNGQRVMISGSHSFHFNVFTDTPQLHGGHDPMQPNDLMAIAVYLIYSGTNTGDQDAAISTLWLKALGAHAISVPGPGSSEYYKPFANPRKFEGVLPVLWREGPDTIYGVPSRSTSLAHVVPNQALVRDKPVNGLDNAQIEKYVAAMDDPTFPEAPMTWLDWNHGEINARVLPGQSVSIQITYHPGWHARVNSQEQSVRKDGLGFLVVEPRCESACKIVLEYDGGTERKATLAASFIVMLGVFSWGVYRRKPQATSKSSA